MKKLLPFFIISYLSALVNLAYAQCAEKWDNARLSYEQGHLYGIPSELSDCLEHGFDKQEKIEAYRLLTVTYLYIDDPNEAQNSFLNLLKLDPEYRIKPSDPIELEHLSREYITTPIISWKVKGGINYSFINVLNKNSTGNDLLNTETYTPLIAYSVAGSIETHFNKVLTFGVDIDFSTNSYQYSNRLFDNTNGDQNAKDYQVFKETSYNAGLPVYLKLTYPGVKNYPFIYAGYAPYYNLYTKSNAEYTIVQGENRIPLGPETLNITPIRTQFSNSIFIGAGLMRRVKYKYIFVDVRYRLGLTKLLNVKKQYEFTNDPGSYPAINKYSLTYSKVDSNFKESDISLSVGFVWPKYKPRKKQSITFASMLKGIFKNKKKDE